MTALDDAVIAAETSLIGPAVRRDRFELERLLDESFTEIGQSGRLWRRDEVIDALVRVPVAEPEPGTAADGATVSTAELPTPVDTTRYERAITEAEVRPLTADTVLLTYLLRFDGTRSRRASIWRVGEAPKRELRMLFHQGTSLAEPQ